MADKDLVSVQQARDLVEAAHRAQGQLARFDQGKIDRVCEAMARAALREAARLGAMATEETGYGIPDDKREKNRFAAEDVWNFFKGLRTVGVINESKDVLEIASPRGVVAGIIPSTNPTSTAIFKVLIAVKSRNAIVLSPHPSAAKCINETARVMREAGVKEGLPAEAVVADAPVAKQVREEFVAQGAHFLSSAEADQLAKIVTTEKRALNPGIVGRSVEVIAKMAGLTVPPGTRCLMAEVGGVGREFPLSMEKLSPILAFYVEDGLERGAARCFEILSYGGMGHTAGIHTRSREAAQAFGIEMPASRIIVNSPTTHGAIGFSTALPPSMTLGCGSWGGNVTSDNVSPWHLMDIKRVAFETRPVKSARPARTAQQPAASPLQPAPAAAGVSRDDIAKIVDRFLSQ